jgi:hypothetical protein
VIYEVNSFNDLILNGIFFISFASQWVVCRYTITFFNPGAKINEAAAFGAERPVIIVHPNRRPLTLGTEY